MLAQKSTGNGGDQYRIALTDLPETAQVRYWVGQLKPLTLTERRAYLDAQFLPEGMARKVAQAAGLPRKHNDAAPEPWTHEEFEEKTAWFNKLHRHVQGEAIFRAGLLREFVDLEVPEGRTKAEYASEWAKAHGVNRSTLYVWLKMVEHLPNHQWVYGLVSEKRPGNAKGGTPKMEVDPGLWAYIRQSWLSQSKPALEPIYRRAVEMASERDLDLPSCKTIARRLAALPRPVVVLAREGEEALDALYPPRRRDYTTLAVHEIWNSDGRMADVHVRWPDGDVRRPMMVAWLDLRTRMLVGWSIGKSESAHLVRKALTASLENSRAVPQNAYLDNGRAFASKEISGGQATRNRFKVQSEEMQGMLTVIGTKVIWAKPYNGKAKPIESFWRTLAEAEKRPEFRGAYCGNKPDNRPDEHDARNAVDFALYQKVMFEEIEAYHDRAHSGDGMGGRSPRQVYAELIAHTVVCQPTLSQIRRCALASQLVTLNRHGEVTILENRYGSDASASLLRGSYTAYYDPNDAKVAVELWDGNEQVATMPLIAKTGFANRDAAQDHSRAKNAFKRATREQQKAVHEMTKAAQQEGMPPTEPQSAAPVPRTKVARLARLGKQLETLPLPTDDDEPTFTREEYLAARDRGEKLRYG